MDFNIPLQEDDDEDELLNLMVVDNETSGVVVSNDPGMARAMGHEAYVDKDGVVKLGRVTTDKTRDERRAAIPSRYKDYVDASVLSKTKRRHSEKESSAESRGQKRKAQSVKEGGSVAVEQGGKPRSPGRRRETVGRRESSPKRSR